jgi:hypothetical protein
MCDTDMPSAAAKLKTPATIPMGRLGKASEIADGVKDLLLILLTATATTQAKLTDFWFNNSSDDAQLVKEATSYAMNGPNNNNHQPNHPTEKDEE